MAALPEPAAISGHLVDLPVDRQPTFRRSDEDRNPGNVSTS